MKELFLFRRISTVAQVLTAFQCVVNERAQGLSWLRAPSFCFTVTRDTLDRNECDVKYRCNIVNFTFAFVLVFAGRWPMQLVAPSVTGFTQLDQSLS